MNRDLSEIRHSYVDVYFPEGCKQRTYKGIYQYDHGLKLRIGGFTSQKIINTQFAYDGIDKAITTLSTLQGQYLESDIPDAVLLQCKEVTCYIYLEDETSGITVKEIRFPITPRAEPADISLTPEQVDSYNKLVAELNKLIDIQIEANKHHPIIQDGTWWIWNAETGAYVDSGNKAQGDKGDDGFSPVVTVTPTAGGNNVSIQDAQGTQEFEVKNGIDGTDGIDGVSPTVKTEAIEGGNRVSFTDKEGTKTVDIKDGVDGQDGFSPVVTTAPIDGGNKLTVTDKNGEQSFNVMDGVKGDTGNSGVYVGADPVPEGTHVQVDPPAEGDIVSVPEVFQDFGDSTVDTISQDAISKEFMKPEYRNLIVTASKNSLGGYNVDYSSSEIRNFVNGGGTVELRYSDTELGDQIYQYESFKDNIAYFRRNIITEDTAERINVGVHYDKSIQVDRIFLNWKTLIKALEDRIANIENVMTKSN